MSKSQPSQPCEVEIYVGPDEERMWMTKFGQVQSAPHFIDGNLKHGEEVPPLMIFDLHCVAAALSPAWGHCECERGGTLLRATPDGFIRLDARDGSWVWELFPVRWSDGENYPCYVGVWRD